MSGSLRSSWLITPVLQSAHLPAGGRLWPEGWQLSSTPDNAQFLQTLEYSRMCVSPLGSDFPLTWWGERGLDKGSVWGKSFALDTPLPTPTGWTTMEDVKEGDYLFGPDGKPTLVTYKSPVLWLDCYRVTFQ